VSLASVSFLLQLNWIGGFVVRSHSVVGLTALLCAWVQILSGFLRDRISGKNGTTASSKHGVTTASDPSLLPRYTNIKSSARFSRSSKETNSLSANKSNSRSTLDDDDDDDVLADGPVVDISAEPETTVTTTATASADTRDDDEDVELVSLTVTASIERADVSTNDKGPRYD
jgi:hypothetical protein